MSIALMHTDTVFCQQSRAVCIAFQLSSRTHRAASAVPVPKGGLTSRMWSPELGFVQESLFISRRKMTFGLYTVDVSLLQLSNEIAALARHPVHRATRLVFWVLMQGCVLCTGAELTGLPHVWESPTNTGHPPNLDNLPEPNRNKDRSSKIQACCSLFSETTQAKINTIKKKKKACKRQAKFLMQCSQVQKEKVTYIP